MAHGLPGDVSHEAIIQLSDTIRRQNAGHDALVAALRDCERDARVALMSNQPKKYLEAILENARAALDAAEKE